MTIVELVASESDTRLVERARSGDRAAWREIVNRFDDSLHRVARAHRLDRPTCADVVQQAWLSAFAHLDALRSAACLGPWLRSITRRESRRVLAMRTRELARPRLEPEDPADRLPSNLPGPEEVILRGEQRALLRMAWRQLSERDRDLLALLMAEPRRPYAEISRHIGLPIGSIGPTRARCLARLRNELKTLGVDHRWVAA